MIIKNLTRKKTGTGQLVRYILRYVLDEHKQVRTSKDRPFLIRHNIRTHSIADFIQEFKQNQANRIYKRSDQTIIHHTILSWAKADTKHITDAKLKSMVKEYIRLRGRNNLYVGTKHEDKDHVHVHLAMSGSQLNGLASRISKQSFEQLKIDLDKYQQRQFPELVSLPEHGRKRRQKTLGKAISWHLSDRTAATKSLLQKTLQGIYKTARTQEEFLKKLAAHGHEPYYRLGRLTGITVKGRKYRFATLCCDIALLRQLDVRREKEQSELRTLKSLRSRSKAKERSKEDYERERSIKTPYFEKGIGELPIESISGNHASPW